MAASLQFSTAGSSFSSSFLQKLSNLVQSIHPNSFQVKLGAADKQSTSTFRRWTQAQADISFASPRSNAPCPKSPLVPRLSLEVYLSELDEQSEALDQEIEALVAFWEHWPCTTGGSVSSGTCRVGNWDQGHPLDLNDEYIREDPNYDEAQVEQEALRDYLKEVSLQCTDATSGQMASQKCDALATSEYDGRAAESEQLPVLLERPSTSTRTVPKLSPRRLALLKKPCVVLRRVSATRQLQEVRDKLGTTSSSSSSDEKEVRSLPKKIPLGSIVHGYQDKMKKRQAFSTDENSRLDVSKQKVLRHHPCTNQQSTTDHPSKSSGTSCSPSVQPYNLRHQNKALGYASQKEEGDGDELSSIEDSEEEWSPDSEGSADEEEEDSGDGEEEDDGEEEVEKIEVGARPDQHTPMTRNLKVATRSYPCPECGRMFSNSSNMRKHLRIHKKEFPFSCHACGKSYSDPSNLAKHQLSHGGERLHKCSHCPKAFFQKTHLDEHLRRHQGIRPFSCLDCKSSFFSQAALANHIKIHVLAKGSSRPRPLLLCTDCDKTFAGTRLLRKHQRRHKSFKCDYCTEVFTLKFKYLVHKMSHEGSGEICGANSSGAHPSRRPAGDSPRLASATQDASTLPGIVALQSPDPAAGAGHLTETPGSAQATVRTLCAGRPSVVTRPLLSVSGKPSASAGTTIRSKPPSMPVSARVSSVAPTNCPEKSSSSQTAGRPITPGRLVAPARPLPATWAGVRSQDLSWSTIEAKSVAALETLVLPNGMTGAAVPVVPTQAMYPKFAGPVPTVTSSGPVVSPLPPPSRDKPPAYMTMVDGPIRNTVSIMGQSAVGSPVQLLPFAYPIKSMQPATTPSSAAPGDPCLVRPSTEALIAFPRGTATLPPVRLASSDIQPFTAMTPRSKLGSGLPSGSNPNGAVTTNNVKELNPSMLPPGTNMSLEVPGQKILPTLTAQVCPLCHMKYWGMHNCKASHRNPASRTGGKERRISSLKIDENTASDSWRSSPDLQPPPEVQGERQTVPQQARSQVAYTSQMEGDGSNLGGDCEDDWQPDKLTDTEEAEEPPTAGMKRPRLHSPHESRGSRRTKRRQGRHMCNICDKHFVFQRSLKHHMRLHYAFSCNQCTASFLRREQLSWHMLSHAKGIAT